MLLDENDNVPRFDSAFYNVSVTEEEWPPQRVTQVSDAAFLQDAVFLGCSWKNETQESLCCLLHGAKYSKDARTTV